MISGILDSLYSISVEANQAPEQNEMSMTTMVSLAVIGATALAIGVIGYKRGTVQKLLLPNETQKIYFPPRFDLSTIEPSYTNKVKRLQNNPNIMGMTCVPRREGEELVPVYIEKAQGTGEEAYIHKLLAKKITDDSLIGFAQLNLLTEKNIELMDLWGPEPVEWRGYGPSEATDGPFVNKVLLDQVTNKQPNKYKNVGMILLKAIIQNYYDDFQGRVLLQAVRNTHPYHYKLGFRVSQQNQEYLNAKFAKLAQSSTPVDQNLGSVYMHLPEQAINLWRREIEQDPIRFPE